MATTKPPISWLLDPAPEIRFCNNAESTFFARLNLPLPRSRSKDYQMLNPQAMYQSQ
jgi:hypothetical protein